MSPSAEVQGLLRLPNNADTAARVQAWAEANPVVLFDIATAIATGDGVWPAEAVTRTAHDAVGLVERAAPADVRAAIGEMLMGREVDHALEWLRQTGLLAVVFPELEATVHLVQETGRQHKDVWGHTKQVVKQAVRRPLVRWAALLHDIGKVPTRTFTTDGVHFHGHAEVGARMFDKVSQRLPFDRDDRRTIRFLIRHHLRSNQYSSQWTDSAVRRFHREMLPHLRDLLDLSRADITSKRPGRRKQILEQISALSDRMERLAEEDARLPPLPGGVGNAIMETFRLPPSRLIGDLKRYLEEQVATGALEARREDAYYVAHLARSGRVPGLDPEEAARIAGAGGLDDEAAAAALDAERAGDLAGPAPEVEPEDHDGDPERPHDGPAPCGADGEGGGGHGHGHDHGLDGGGDDDDDPAAVGEVDPDGHRH
ncbi:MAG: HD domain-containing protein [Myxococcales bacterium]|nr:HD domain-containing protein [Myxococcales bacterium]